MNALLVLSHRKSLGAAVAASLLSVFVLAAPACAQQPEATAVLPESLKWNPTPFPDVTVAVVAGNPLANGVYAIFAKYKAEGRSAPHTHPDQRVVTVLSGTYYSGLGTAFDEAKLRPFHPGSVLIVPANTPHYALAKDGETIVQEVGMGPTGTNIWPKATVNQWPPSPSVCVAMFAKGSHRYAQSPALALAHHALPFRTSAKDVASTARSGEHFPSPRM